MEEVLVFPSSLFDELGPFDGFCDRVGGYLPTLLAPANLLYIDRAAAEVDPTYKQLIPYVILRHEEEVYTYSRGIKGGEERLHRRLSIGIGGHIRRDDGREGREAYQAGFQRELDEEVKIHCPYQSSIVGMVHDGQTEVGRVHFGIVHLIELARPEVEAVDPALAEGRFRPIEELIQERARLETWSTFVLDRVLAVRQPYSSNSTSPLNTMMLELEN